jgi:dolichol-phosphate mannosyltransferase
LNQRGLASALSQGTKLAKGEIVVWLDCDLGISPEDIQRLVECLEEYDIAIGSRYVSGGEDRRPPFRAFLSRLFNGYTRLILGSNFRDWTSGFAAARRQVLEELPLSDQGFGEYFIEWVYRAHQSRFKIIEVGYSYGLRKAGTSKTDGNWLRFFELGLSYSWRVLWVKWIR